jgi:hypothetical protein
VKVEGKQRAQTQGVDVWMQQHVCTLRSCFAVQVLNAWGNQLTALPEGFGTLTSLARLGLKGNQLAALPNSFTGLSSLVELFLTDNKLTTLPAGAQPCSCSAVCTRSVTQPGLCLHAQGGRVAGQSVSSRHVGLCAGSPHKHGWRHVQVVEHMGAACRVQQQEHAQNMPFRAVRFQAVSLPGHCVGGFLCRVWQVKVASEASSLVQPL